MAKLTIAVDDGLLRRARLKAVREGTSVSQLLRERLEAYVDVDPRRAAALRSILEFSRKARSGSEGRRVRRDDIYGE